MRLPTPRRHPALQPEQLSELTQKAVDELMREGESQNTLASYRAALRYWAAWYGLRYGQAITLPLPPACVLQFVVDHAQRQTAQGLAHELPAEFDTLLVSGGYKGKSGPLAITTVLHRVAVLSKAHQLRELRNPCQDAKVKDLLAHTRRAYAKRGDLPQKKAALTRDPLLALLATCDESLRGKRDRALLLFAWASGGRRRSEVAGAVVEQLKRLGSGEFSYNLAYSKSNQNGNDRPENHKPVHGPAGAALEAWLQASGIRSGPIFRRVLRGGHLGPQLSAAAVRDVVRRHCLLAGIDGNYSAHSLRSGFVTEAGRQQVPLGETMALTGHRSAVMALSYYRAGGTESTGPKLL